MSESSRKKAAPSAAAGDAPKHGTLAWLAKVSFADGREAARKVVSAKTAPESFARHHIVRAGDGREVLRTELAEDDERIKYWSYNPPALWGAPYVVLLAEFQPTPRDDYMHHDGEELLVPVSGGVDYHFFCGDDGGAPARRTLTSPLAQGDVIRVNPLVPHHTWAAPGGPATAWMVLWDPSESPAAIALNPHLHTRGRPHYSVRTWSAAELANPTTYILLATGLAKRVRAHREAARLALAQLANFCDVEPTQLSRLEAALPGGNISLEGLLRVASFLRLPFETLLDNPTWAYRRASLGGGAPHVAGVPHRLHTRALRLKPGTTRKLASPAPGAFVSWIALKGRGIFAVREDGREREQILEAGSVAHFRGEYPHRVEVREPLELLEVVHSTQCVCEAPAPRRPTKRGRSRQKY